MADLSITTPDFTAGTKILSSEVDTNNSDITSYINTRNQGNTDWDFMSSAGLITGKDGFRSSDETAATPGYAFTSSTGTGLFLVTTNTLGFATGGTQRMEIDASGFVGIGTATPDGTLHVHTASAGSVTAAVDADDLVVENSGSSGITIFSGNTNNGSIFFGDAEDNNVAQILYDHSSNIMAFLTNAGSAIFLDASQQVHIQPSGTADVELEVSNGASTGGGTVHRAASGTHSSAAIKSHINYLDNVDCQKAYDEVKALKPVTFKYKKKQDKTPNSPLVEDANAKTRRGLILEDSPASIKDGSAVMIDDRILNLEMMAQILISKVETLESI